ncbi:D-3-phosphoglycerate dehydrogenase [Georgenia soli]|uniref:D-3-phosphoglycerate dehydrogenase n=1 Tax=Georgenia soli TaxID=638953 RepID=A0A2A9EKF3_9MICO|nr:C-terminal binding protein [Georgenia soli]PFG39424.1 D-3-phosphoglycerate dehydrogenase [Georgenia soli]
MRIVITDCDHASVDIERAVAGEAGAELVVAQGISPAEVIANAEGADGLVVQYAQITAAVMDALPNLKAVGRYGVGVDTVDVEAATARGVAVCNVPDYGTEAVSDHAIALALAVSRGLVALDRGTRAGRPNLAEVNPIFQVRGRTFGVLGFGAIGRATARKAAGVGYEVVVHDTAVEPGTLTEEGYEAVSLEELLRRSQVLSVHVPLVPATHHLLDATRLALLPEHAVVVNTSRGGVVDTDALVDALRSGHLLGAGLDVFETEPLPADHPLTELDRVVLTPHAGFYTEESYAELKRRTIQNVVDVVAGRRPRNILNPSVLGGTR